jgi:thermostable 8-oxoguanine DNA glycosylase
MVAKSKALKQIVKKTRNNDIKKEFLAQCVKDIAMKIVDARDNS